MFARWAWPNATMKTLPVSYLYRLRMLDGGPRFYKPELLTKRLERQRLIEATGRRDPDGERAEYAITQSGREALRRSGLDDPGA